MKKINLILLTVLFFMLASCKKNEEVIDPDPQFLPPISELKYTNNGTFHFGFGQYGKYEFSTDVVGQYKLIIKRSENYSSVPGITTFTLKYSGDYRLQEIQTKGETFDRHLYFTYDIPGRLTRMEEWENGVKYVTFTVKQEDIATGTRITIGPYAASTGTTTDSLVHILETDFGGEVQKVWQKSWHPGT